MIRLTRLNGDEFVINADLIRSVEQRPDTYVMLTTGDRLIVRESLSEVIGRALAWARAVRLGTQPEVPAGSLARSTADSAEALPAAADESSDTPDRTRRTGSAEAAAG